MSGPSNPRSRKFASLREPKSGKLLSYDTLLDYYRKGAVQLALVDADFAREIEAEAAVYAKRGRQHPLGEAILRASDGDAERSYVNWRRYERGRGRLGKLENQ